MTETMTISDHSSGSREICLATLCADSTGPSNHALRSLYFVLWTPRSHAVATVANRVVKNAGERSDLWGKFELPAWQLVPMPSH